jgi:hypothetical protein
MRRAARKDANHDEIADALRAAGCWVLDLSAVGGGCPDLLVHGPVHPWSLVLVEIKDGSKPPSRRPLTPAQIKLHAGCNAPRVVVTSVDEALAAVGVSS